MSETGKYCYTKEHEWACAGAEGVSVGLSDYAQQELGDVVFVELPEVGLEVKQGETFTTVESVKAVSEVYAPVSGKVVKVNDNLNDVPELINSDPLTKGWIVVIEAADMSQLESLMTEEDYQTFVKELSE